MLHIKESKHAIIESKRISNQSTNIICCDIHNRDSDCTHSRVDHINIII